MLSLLGITVLMLKHVYEMSRIAQAYPLAPLLSTGIKLCWHSDLGSESERNFTFTNYSERESRNVTKSQTKTTVPRAVQVWHIPTYLPAIEVKLVVEKARLV